MSRRRSTRNDPKSGPLEEYETTRKPNEVFLKDNCSGYAIRDRMLVCAAALRAFAEYRWKDVAGLVPNLLLQTGDSCDLPIEMKWRLMYPAVKNIPELAKLEDRIHEDFRILGAKELELALAMICEELPRVRHENMLEFYERLDDMCYGAEKFNFKRFPELFVHLKSIIMGYMGMIVYYHGKQEFAGATKKELEQNQEEAFDRNEGPDPEKIHISSMKKALSNFTWAVNSLSQPCEWLMEPYIDAVRIVNGNHEAVEELKKYLEKHSSHLPALRLAYQVLENFPECEGFRQEKLKEIVTRCPDDPFVLLYVDHILAKGAKMKVLIESINMLMDMVEFKEWHWNVKPWEKLCSVLRKAHQKFRSQMHPEIVGEMKTILEERISLWKRFIWIYPNYEEISINQAEVLFYTTYAAFVFETVCGSTIWCDGKYVVQMEHFLKDCGHKLLAEGLLDAKVDDDYLKTLETQKGQESSGIADKRRDVSTPKLKKTSQKLHGKNRYDVTVSFNEDSFVTSTSKVDSVKDSEESNKDSIGMYDSPQLVFLQQNEDSDLEEMLTCGQRSPSSDATKISEEVECDNDDSQLPVVIESVKNNTENVLRKSFSTIGLVSDLDISPRTFSSSSSKMKMSLSNFVENSCSNESDETDMYSSLRAFQIYDTKMIDNKVKYKSGCVQKSLTQKSPQCQRSLVYEMNNFEPQMNAKSSIAFQEFTGNDMSAEEVFTQKGNKDFHGKHNNAEIFNGKESPAYELDSLPFPIFESQIKADKSLVPHDCLINENTVKQDCSQRNLCSASPTYDRDKAKKIVTQEIYDISFPTLDCSFSETNLEIDCSKTKRLRTFTSPRSNKRVDHKSMWDPKLNCLPFPNFESQIENEENFDVHNCSFREGMEANHRDQPTKQEYPTAAVHTVSHGIGITANQACFEARLGRCLCKSRENQKKSEDISYNETDDLPFPTFESQVEHDKTTCVQGYTSKKDQSDIHQVKDSSHKFDKCKSSCNQKNSLSETDDLPFPEFESQLNNEEPTTIQKAVMKGKKEISPAVCHPSEPKTPKRAAQDCYSKLKKYNDVSDKQKFALDVEDLPFPMFESQINDEESTTIQEVVMKGSNEISPTVGLISEPKTPKTTARDCHSKFKKCNDGSSKKSPHVKSRKIPTPANHPVKSDNPATCKNNMVKTEIICLPMPDPSSRIKEKRNNFTEVFDISDNSSQSDDFRKQNLESQTSIDSNYKNSALEFSDVLIPASQIKRENSSSPQDIDSQESFGLNNFVDHPIKQEPMEVSSCDYGSSDKWIKGNSGLESITKPCDTKILSCKIKVEPSSQIDKETKKTKGKSSLIAPTNTEGIISHGITNVNIKKEISSEDSGGSEWENILSIPRYEKTKKGERFLIHELDDISFEVGKSKKEKGKRKKERREPLQTNKIPLATCFDVSDVPQKKRRMSGSKSMNNLKKSKGIKNDNKKSVSKKVASSVCRDDVFASRSLVNDENSYEVCQDNVIAQSTGKVTTISNLGDSNMINSQGKQSDAVHFKTLDIDGEILQGSEWQSEALQIVNEANDHKENFKNKIKYIQNKGVKGHKRSESVGSVFNTYERVEKQSSHKRTGSDCTNNTSDKVKNRFSEMDNLLSYPIENLKTDERKKTQKRSSCISSEKTIYERIEVSPQISSCKVVRTEKDTITPIKSGWDYDIDDLPFPDDDEFDSLLTSKPTYLFAKDQENIESFTGNKRSAEVYLDTCKQNKSGNLKPSDIESKGESTNFASKSKGKSTNFASKSKGKSTNLAIKSKGESTNFASKGKGKATNLAIKSKGGSTNFAIKSKGGSTNFAIRSKEENTNSLKLPSSSSDQVKQKSFATCGNIDVVESGGESPEMESRCIPLTESEKRKGMSLHISMEVKLQNLESHSGSDVGERFVKSILSQNNLAKEDPKMLSSISENVEENVKSSNRIQNAGEKKKLQKNFKSVSCNVELKTDTLTTYRDVEKKSKKRKRPSNISEEDDLCIVDALESVVKKRKFGDKCMISDNDKAGSIKKKAKKPNALGLNDWKGNAVIPDECEHFVTKKKKVKKHKSDVKKKKLEKIKSDVKEGIAEISTEYKVKKKKVKKLKKVKKYKSFSCDIQKDDAGKREKRKETISKAHRFDEKIEMERSKSFKSCVSDIQEGNGEISVVYEAVVKKKKVKKTKSYIKEGKARLSSVYKTAGNDDKKTKEWKYLPNDDVKEIKSYTSDDKLKSSVSNMEGYSNILNSCGVGDMKKKKLKLKSAASDDKDGNSKISTVCKSTYDMKNEMKESVKSPKKSQGIVRNKKLKKLKLLTRIDNKRKSQTGNTITN